MTFDVSNVLTVVSEFFVSGVGVYALTAAAKKLSFIPLQEGQTVKIRAVAGVLSALGTGLISFSNGVVGTEDMQAIVAAITGCGFAWLTSHAVHKTLTGNKQ